MKIGIIGLGIVGSAIKYGFDKLGHKTSIFDIKFKDSRIENVLNTDVCFICVPTPSNNNDDSCNISIVEDTFNQLKDKQYNGIIAIKSTVTPGTTQRLWNKSNNHKVCFVPEFLRERCSVSDFTENHDLCIIGLGSEKDNDVYDIVKEIHGCYPKKFAKLTCTEAEMCKYFNNIYNATLITFANSFCNVCNHFNVDYNTIKNTMKLRDHITKMYIDSNSSFKGFGGPCLPKDLKALQYIIEKENINTAFFRMILEENSKYTATVPEGMRE